MFGDELIASFHVRRRENSPDAVQGHVKIAKAPNNLRYRDLLGGVPPVAGLRINLRGLKKPAS